ncbi:MAG: winged helix-turn-helix domain-containing protein [Candidatus Heimdallarchaeota archaeon]
MKVNDEISGAILSHLAQNKEQTFSALEKTGINPKTLTNRLQLLKQYGLIRKEGRNYVITEKGQSMLQVMRHLHTILEPAFPDFSFLESKIPNELIRRALARYIYLLIEYFGKKLVCVLLFGSAAKGTMTDKSDLDLLIIVRDWDVSLWERTTELLTIRQQMRATVEYKALQAHQQAF